MITLESSASFRKTKDEVKEKIIQNVQLLERELGHKVRFIRTDGGKEYLGPAWETICVSEGSCIESQRHLHLN